MTTPLLSLPEIAEGVANQVPIHNTALRHIEAKLVRALSMITMAPPAAVEGDSYIIPAGASGAWSGKTGQIAAFIGGAWSYAMPIEGVRLWVNDLDVEYVYDGAAWITNGGGDTSGAITDAITAHEAAADPHTQYQKESEKGVANGYASLGADGKVPSAQLPAATAQPFDIHTFYPGVPSASAKLYRGKLARAVTFPANFAGAQFTASVNATGSTVFDIQKNGVSVGSCTIAAGGIAPTFASTGGAAVSFAAGDVFSVIAPATADATLADPAITFAGTR